MLVESRFCAKTTIRHPGMTTALCGTVCFHNKHKFRCYTWENSYVNILAYIYTVYTGKDPYLYFARYLECNTMRWITYIVHRLYNRK